MLRTAVHYLLALLLCLNGVFAPVVMAQHGALPAASAAAEPAMPCHEMGADMADHAGMTDHGDLTDHGGPSGKHDPNCCKHGQCVCSCVAANVPAAPAAVRIAAGTRLALPASHDVAASRYAVALRPPIR